MDNGDGISKGYGAELTERPGSEKATRKSFHTIESSLAQHRSKSSRRELHSRKRFASPWQALSSTRCIFPERRRRLSDWLNSRRCVPESVLDPTWLGFFECSSGRLLVRRAENQQSRRFKITTTIQFSALMFNKLTGRICNPIRLRGDRGFDNCYTPWKAWRNRRRRWKGGITRRLYWSRGLLFPFQLLLLRTFTGWIKESD